MAKGARRHLQSGKKKRQAFLVSMTAKERDEHLRQFPKRGRRPFTGPCNLWSSGRGVPSS